MFDEDGICETCRHMVTLRDGDRVLVACVRGHDIDGDDGARLIDSVPMECDDYADFEENDWIGASAFRTYAGEWVRTYQREHGELETFGPSELRELANSLHDDIPFGYEASVRLAQWLMCFKATDDQIGDGFHTMAELYHHRAVLFSVIVRDHQDMAWKSMMHHDGTMYDGMFIVGIDTPLGQATYHYDIDPYWDMFDCRELDRAPVWDGHTPDEAIERIASIGTRGCHYQYATNISMGGVSLDCCGLRCDTCGHEQMSMNAPKFCPECGRRVLR